MSLALAAFESVKEICVPTGAPLREICASRDPSRQRAGSRVSDEIVAGVVGIDRHVDRGDIRVRRTIVTFERELIRAREVRPLVCR